MGDHFLFLLRRRRPLLVHLILGDFYHQNLLRIGMVPFSDTTCVYVCTGGSCVSFVFVFAPRQNKKTLDNSHEKYQRDTLKMNSFRIEFFVCYRQTIFIQKINHFLLHFTRNCFRIKSVAVWCAIVCGILPILCSTSEYRVENSVWLSALQQQRRW